MVFESRNLGPSASNSACGSTSKICHGEPAATCDCASESRVRPRKHAFACNIAIASFEILSLRRGPSPFILVLLFVLRSHELLRMIVVQQVASNLCRIDFCVHVDISIRMESYLRYFEINSLEIKNSLDNVEHLSLWITRTETTSEIRLINVCIRKLI
jgi:hypothetical protein